MMKGTVRVWILIGVLLPLLCVTAMGQTPAPPPVMLKVQVTISRYMGTNKLSSQPYVLALAPGESGSIRFGTEVPVPAAYTNPNSSNTTANNPQPSYTMQQVGTQLDANATLQPDGRYKLRLNVTERNVLPNAQAAELGSRVATVPSFRNMVFGSTVYLMDGQTSQFSSATDKATGEVFKVEVSLAVEK